MSKNEIIIKLLSMLFERNEAYHDQKEKMIHAGVLIEIGLLTGITSLNKLPFDCISLNIIIFILLWLIIYSFIRFHSLYKRTAAVYRIAYERALWLCYNDSPKNNNTKLNKKKNESKLSKTKIILSFLFPFYNDNLFLDSDVTKAERNNAYYSNFFYEILDKSRNEHVGATNYEVIISIGSIIILIIGIIKIVLF